MIPDNHYKKDCVILKMTQKFAFDTERPAESQIRKAEFNLEKGVYYIHYHYKEGKVTANSETFIKDELLATTKVGDMNEKDTEENKQQQVYKRMLDMERKCQEQIKI